MQSRRNSIDRRGTAAKNKLTVGGYQPLTEGTEETESPAEGELESEQPETEEDSVILRDNMPRVDLSKFNTDGREAHYIQINHFVGKLSGNKITKDTIKKAEFEFMLDLNSLISRTTIDPRLTRVRASMRRAEDRETTPDGYRPEFDKLSIRLGLVFMDDNILIQEGLQRRLLDILHFSHAGRTKMTAETKIFWLPDINRDLQNKVKDCIACLASGKKVKYQLPNNHFGKLKKTNRTGSRNTNRF